MAAQGVVYQTRIDHRHYKPIVRAYLVALFSTVSPRLFTLLVLLSKKRWDLRACIKQASDALVQQLQLDRFPAACALLVGGATILPKPLLSVFEGITGEGKSTQSSTSRTRLAVTTFVASFASALLSFALMNRRPTKEEQFHREALQNQQDSLREDQQSESTQKTKEVDAAAKIPLAGRTLDLTFFAAVRAVDVGIRKSWSYLKKTKPDYFSGRTALWTEKLASPAVFSLSSSIIMWAWFYQPHRLPRSYARWITSVAQVDERLITALRECRFGNFVYGKDTGMAPLLGSMCTDLGLPEVWGDPAKTVPVPCELYHSGLSPSCEWHATKRFMNTYQFAMLMNLPLNVLLSMRKKLNLQNFYQALLDADRSSAFLSAFVALFYYGVCLARTRLGPKVFSRDTVTPMMWDGGYCVGVGCMLCGWSVLWEKESRQRELAYFVAPRALGTVFSRRYDREYLWSEQAAFALSAATVLTTAQLEPGQIKGVFGAILNHVLR